MSYSNYAEYLSHPRFRESVKAARERSGGKCEQCQKRHMLTRITLDIVGGATLILLKT
jgi:hypothetical protein